MAAMPAGAAQSSTERARPIHPRPLTVDVLLTLGSRFSILILNVAAAVVIARTLGPAGRGAVAVAFSFTLLLIQFGILGLHSANTYFASRAPDQISRILANALWTSVVVGSLLALIGLALWEVFPNTLRGLDLVEVAVVLVGVPFALEKLLLQSILLAEGRMVAYNGIEVATAVAMVCGLAIGLGFFSFGVLGAIVLFVSVNVAGSVGYILLLRHHRPSLRGIDLRLFRAMLRYGARIYVAALLAYVVWRANVLLVNAYLGNYEAGQFAIAVGLGEAIFLLPTVVSLNLFPRIARGDKSGDTGAVFRSLLLIYAVLCAATIPIAGPLIRLLYGPQFADAVPIFYWLLPGIFCYGMVSVLSYHFAGRGFPASVLVVWFAGVVLNLAVILPSLSRHASVDFAAIAASLAFALILVLHMRMFAAETGGYSTLLPRPRETLELTRQMYRALRSRPAPSTPDEASPTPSSSVAESPFDKNGAAR